MYDASIREWMEQFRQLTPNAHTGQRTITDRMGRVLMDKKGRERPDDENDPGRFIYWRPDFVAGGGDNKSGVDMSTATIFRHAHDLQNEQQLVNDNQLSLEYMRYQKSWDELVAEGTVIETPKAKSAEQVLAEDARFAEQRLANKTAMEAARAVLQKSEAAAKQEREEWLRKNPTPPEPEPTPSPPPTPEFPRDWTVVLVAECHDAFKHENVPVVDVRGARDYDREHVVGSVNIPAVSVIGKPLHWEREPLTDFVATFVARFPNVDATIVVIGSRDSEFAPDGAAVCLAKLRDAGYVYCNAAETEGGYDNWVKQVRVAFPKSRRAVCRLSARNYSDTWPEGLTLFVHKTVHPGWEETNGNREVHERGGRAWNDLRVFGNHHATRRRVRRPVADEEIDLSLKSTFLIQFSRSSSISVRKK